MQTKRRFACEPSRLRPCASDRSPRSPFGGVLAPCFDECGDYGRGG